MNRAFSFIRVHKRFFTLLAAVFLSVSMMLMGEGSKSRTARAVTTAVFNTGRFTFSWGIYILDLWHENKRLRIQNLELSDRIRRHDIAVSENKRLRKMLGFKKRLELGGTVVAGMVIGHDFDRIVNTIIVDAGSREGIRKNMAVVTTEGLVGKVYEVYRSSSSVQIIMDVNSRISARVSGINGIMRWEGGPYLRMYGLPLSMIPKAGADVYTTGFGIYPEGIYIGRVVSPHMDDVERYASVNVEPDVDFSAVQEVFFIRGSACSDVWDDGDGKGEDR
ncbi:MAG: rod shape-determining protein MreC, partial [Candidatus Latescibacteria bacterium]|nr:rod shape-determining protein MreC [Candidatus Latescibacterota bacterium]